ncbi:hypothetical protein [Tenacibaculum sp. M341]|uniref:hypothetical protein n=1 Tax=Tenacibaculum sp. M341 TaxID=2530339 RepID=UPI00104DCD02|nr:hypothetical protein [Tenacibaculum sp. M341]TCI85264.1 hypothetical protein EYW44_17625 [Tenacibaculum sp. M341]
MKHEQKNDYVLFSLEEGGFPAFGTYFEDHHHKFAKNNIFIYLSSKLDISFDEISLFLKYSDLHQDNGTTFVVVYPNIDVDRFPEQFNIVPTLQEAEDVLEMENIQRDLGF